MRALIKSASAILLLFYFIALITGISWNFVPATSGILTTTYKISLIEYGSLYSIFVVGALITSIYCSIFGDRVGFYRLIVAATFCNFLSSVLFSFIDFIPGENFLWIALGMFILGVGVGGVIIGLGVGAIHAAKKYKTTSLILIFAFLGIGSAITPTYVKIANSYELLGGSCLLLGAFYAIQMFSAFFNKYLKKLEINLKHYETISHMISFWKAIPKTLWIIAVAVFLYSISEVAFWDWGVIYLNKVKGLSDTQVGTASSFYWLAATLSDIVFALIFLKWNYRRYYIIIPILIFVAYLVLVGSHRPSYLIFSLSLAGFACTPFFPLSVRLASETFSKVETRAFGFLLACYFAGSGLCTYSIGVLEDMFSITIKEAFFIIPVIAIALFALILIFYSKVRKLKSDDFV